MGRVMVRFQGDGDGVGELTWSQANLWQGMTLDGPPLTMGNIVSPPRPMTVDDVAEMLRFAVSRHQVLRTRLRLRDGKPPLQVCVSSGEVPLDVVDVGDGDPYEVAQAVENRYKQTPFDYETEFPVRMATVHRDGVTCLLVPTYLHVALDLGAVAVLSEEINARDPATREPIATATSLTALELAKRQQGPAAQRKSAAAMAYLEQVLRAMPVRQFTGPRYPDSGSRVLRMRSRAAALAVQRISIQQGTSTSSALLSAFAVGVTRCTGHPNVTVMLLVSNRFRPGFADAVCPLVQMSPCLIDTSGTTLRGAVSRTAASVLTAYKHAYYDPYQQDVVFDRVEADRGQLEFWQYNDRRALDRTTGTGPVPSDAEIRAAIERTEHTWLPARTNTAMWFLNVLDGPDDTLDFELMAESRFLSDDDMIALTTEFETAAVRTALEPDLPTDFPIASPKAGGSDPKWEVIRHA